MAAQALPPVTRSVAVPIGPESAFALFTQQMDHWWPLQTHSIAADSHGGSLQSLGLVLEEHVGGRLYERLSDGSEGDWGRVLEWDPPRHLALSWRPNLTDGPVTRIDVTFTGGADGTLVELVHTGWEALGERAEAAHGGYDQGWPGVLELYRAHTTAL